MLIGKSLSEQKEIILKFFYEKRKLNKPFKLIYKSVKNIFKDSSLSDSYIQDFINKTFINIEEMFHYSTFNEFHNGTKFDIEEEDFGTFTLIKIKEQVDKLIWNNINLDDLTEKQKKDMVNKINNYIPIPLERWNTVIPIPEKEIRRCSKCGKEVFLGFFVERKQLFRSKTKKWCFSCYNKLKFSAGKLELKEVIITGEKDDSTLGNNITMPSTLPNRVQIPKEDVILEPYTKLSDIGEKWVDCIHINILKSVNNHYACKHINNKSKICNDKDCPIKMILEISDLSTEKDVSKDVELRIWLDRDSKPFLDMTAECFDCGRNIGFKNIPSEICYECSIYDIEKTKNYFKTIKRDEK